jgi:hypothetical protein
MAQETPWSSISPARFLRDVAQNDTATLTVRARPDVATRYWWTCGWMGADGKWHGEAASSLDLLMRRVAEVELALREAWGEGGEDAPPAR